MFDIYGQQWFVYWRFDQDGYYCDSSSVGFAKTHDNREYVRIQGARISQVSETKTVIAEKTVVEPVNKQFSVEPEFIKKVNAAQPFWTAEHNIENEKYTLLEHQSRGGQPVATKETEKSRNMAILFMKAIENNERIHKELADEKQSIPTNLDWRNKNGVNYVSPVDDQASCGSCYAFASAGLMESRVRVGTNNQHQPLFSEQEMITCGQDRTYNQGCAGGWDIFMAGMYGQDYGFVEEGCSDETTYSAFKKMVKLCEFYFYQILHNFPKILLFLTRCTTQTTTTTSSARTPAAANDGTPTSSNTWEVTSEPPSTTAEKR